MKFVQILALAVSALLVGNVAMAQQASPGQPDQVDQLAQMVGLDDSQQTEIRAILEEMQGEIQELQQEAQELQAELQDQIGPDYDESQIRSIAADLGEISGEMTALSTLMQARVDSVFTEEQRQKLEERMQQMRQMQRQRQMQQQQRQMQQQGQGQSQGLQ